MATYPGFTYDMFNVTFKYITANLSSNKNYQLNTTFKNHDKLRLCCEYFQKWITEQAITFKKLTKAKKTIFQAQVQIFSFTSNQAACVLLKSSDNFDVTVKRGLIY